MFAWLKKSLTPTVAQTVAQPTVAIQPGDADADIYNKEKGDKLFAEGKLEEAELCYRQAISINPRFAEVYNNLSNVLRAQLRFNEAEQNLRQAILINPQLSNAHYNLGCLLQQQNSIDEAIECFKRALAIKPDAEIFYRELSFALFYSGRIDAAKNIIMQGLTANPNSADLHFCIGYMKWQVSNLDEALVHFQRALSLHPRHADACFGIGAILMLQHRYEEGFVSLKQTLELDPEYHLAQSIMLYQSQQFCEWNDIARLAGAVRSSINQTAATEKNHHTPLPFLLLPGATAIEQKRCAERYSQIEFRHLIPIRERLNFGSTHPPSDKIRIGYLSGDFRQHAVAFQIVEIFELHDRSRFHVTAYSYGPDDGSTMRKRLENAFDNFVDIHDDSLEDAAKKIHSDRIDVLIDLAGYTRDTRSGILALRPAPIQVNYLGYPGTMGADFVDYLIADRFVIPPESRDCYTENVVWLPDCLMPNDRTRPRLAAPSRTDCGLPEHGFVFCCFNQGYKITREIFDIWCRLLKSVPDSVLWLPASNPHAVSNLRKEAENHGIAVDRIIMASRTSEMADHMARLQCADLFLDTLPYNAHSTCSDALWMGLPVLTCAGDTFPSRVAGSLLTAMGIPELITYNLDDYYRLALELATDRQKLSAIRNKIIANRDSSPLFDSARFTRNLEKAYLAMINERSKGK